jgi:molybdate transport system ATP-binding protein
VAGRHVSLDARIQLVLGTLTLNAELTVADGEMVAVIGPNGAGKTTLLRALAGLVPLQLGRVSVDDLILDDTETGRWLPPERRPIGVVFQDYLLFPHLSALDNVAFGLRATRTGKADARRQALEWLDRVGLADHAGHRPRALSGGQAQRVALARALITQPRLLLLDEPLAAVDVSARGDTRRTLKAALHDFPGARILVTHDPLEAAALAGRIIVLENGTIVQTGTVADVTARPRSPWAAEMVGLNLYRGWADGTSIHINANTKLTAATSGSGEVFAVIAPRAVTLHRHKPESSARNTWPGTTESLDLEGDRVRVRITGSMPIVAEVTPAAVADLHLDEAGPIWVSVKATEVAVYPA